MTQPFTELVDLASERLGASVIDANDEFFAPKERLILTCPPTSVEGRYTERGKREMDFADASLYWLAAETGIRDILTIDVSDFGRYRLPDGQAFNLL